MKVLIIDDNKMHRMIYNMQLNPDAVPEYEIVEADCAEKGKEAIIREKPDCVILDYMMPKTNGFVLLHELYTDPMLKCPPVIFVTCMLQEELKKNVMAFKAFACLDKNKIDAGQIRAAVNSAIEWGKCGNA